MNTRKKANNDDQYLGVLVTVATLGKPEICAITLCSSSIFTRKIGANKFLSSC